MFLILVTRGIKDLYLINDSVVFAGYPFPFIFAGKVSFEDVKTTLPYGNTITMVEVTRCVLEEILEHSVSAMDPPLGRYLQHSGK